MSSFEQQMSQILKALDVFEALLTPNRPTDLASLIQGRVNLSRSVARFLANEWDALPQHLTTDPSKGRPDVDAIHRAFLSLRADYSSHVAGWDSARLVRDWTGYRAGCQHLIRSMRELVRMRAGSPSLQPA